MLDNASSQTMPNHAQTMPPKANLLISISIFVFMKVLSNLSTTMGDGIEFCMHYVNLT